MQTNGSMKLEEVLINGVLLDTSFLIRLLKKDDRLHQNAKDYFKYFLENKIILKCSTIAIAEYCVKGISDQLPLKNIQILPFNFHHAVKAGEFAKIIFEKKGKLELTDRKIIPNDTNMFAQADFEDSIDAYLTSDTESKKIFDILIKNITLSFKWIDIHSTVNEAIGLLDLKFKEEQE